MENEIDIQEVLSKRYDNGGDYWATEDGRLAVGSPFSTLESLQVLHELGVGKNHEAVQGAINLILGSWREDGRYRIAPRGTHYPCFTANAARILCRFGYVNDDRVQQSLSHLLENQNQDHGWRCNKVAMGRSPETDLSNPGVTLFALDAFRFTNNFNNHPALDKAVESLLDHWTVRVPIGPCKFGIGSLFMQVEYPFLRYNIFSYVYVLSFYEQAKGDDRYQEAFNRFRDKLDEEGRVVVERPNRKLSKLAAFTKGKYSIPATKRYQEILENLKA